MQTAEINALVLTPALALLPAWMDSLPARQLLLTIQLQEDSQQRRRQWPQGPARGLWQAEKGGGVLGVLSHHTTFASAQYVCAAREVEPVAAAVWGRLEQDDILAAAFARLLLVPDPKPLPDSPEAGWAYYLRCWRPGHPKIATWLAYWKQAQEALR